MSAEAVLAVLRLDRPDLTMGEQHILMLLAWHFNDREGVTRPSVLALAAEARCYRGSVQRILSKLKQKTLIVPAGTAARGIACHTLSFYTPPTEAADLPPTVRHLPPTETAPASYGGTKEMKERNTHARLKSSARGGARRAFSSARARPWPRRVDLSRPAPRPVSTGTDGLIKERRPEVLKHLPDSQVLELLAHQAFENVSDPKYDLLAADVLHRLDALDLHPDTDKLPEMLFAIRNARLRSRAAVGGVV